MKRKFLFTILFIFCSALSSAAEYSEKDFLNLIPLHEVKRPPGPVDWMAIQNEPGQTYDDYIKSSPAKPGQEKKIIYITLLGEFDETRREIIGKTAEYIEAYYGLPVKFTEPVDLSAVPEKAKRVHPQWRDQQILSTYIMEDVLIPRRPKDAFCVIAFTPQDLWPGPGWNFVFGQASLDERVGVWSIYRNGNPDKNEEEYKLVLKRTVKTGVHEIGHMFGIHHCIYYECLMNGSNHQKEKDARPMALCPIDLRKLYFNTGADLAERCKNLIEISERFGFAEEAEFFKKTLKIFEN